MAKPRKPAVDLAVYLAVRLVILLLQALPPRVARALAQGLAVLAYHIDKRHRAVAAENLRHAFPDLSEAAIDQRVRAVYRHLFTVTVEMVLLPRKLGYLNWRKHVEMAEPNRFVGLLLSGRPVLLVTGHFGNWEMAGYVMGLLGFRTYAIARVLDNPHLERFLRRFRERTGQKILAKKGDFDHLQEVLDSGGVVGTLADQDAGPRGQFVEFFGRPASTHKAVALMALEFGATMLVAGIPKIGEPMRYRVEVADFIDPEDYAGRPDAVKAITQRYTAALERLVRQYPDQYFWLHRRWKHQPPLKKVKVA